jgi:hypothetical protein
MVCYAENTISVSKLWLNKSPDLSNEASIILLILLHFVGCGSRI